MATKAQCGEKYPGSPFNDARYFASTGMMSTGTSEQVQVNLAGPPELKPRPDQRCQRPTGHLGAHAFSWVELGCLCTQEWGA